MSSADQGSAGQGVEDVIRLALAVPGVHAVRVEPAPDGDSLVRLELADGVDEAAVTAAVEQALRARRPPEPRRSPEAELEAPAAGAPLAMAPVQRPWETDTSASTDPLPTPDHAAPTGVTLVVPAAPGVASAPEVAPPPAVAPSQPARPASRPRTGRISVPSVSSPTVAATPAPQWLGEAPSPATGRSPQGSGRLVLDRLDVSTERLSTRASVVLTHGTTTHTGVAEASATAAGGVRAVATATVRALESAVGGRLRADVEAVSLADLGGHRTAIVLLDAATSRGTEQLVGAVLVERDEHASVVRAVLDAANRRIGLDLPTLA